MNEKLECENCAAELEADWNICPVCQTPVNNEPKGPPKCRKCGKELKEGWQLCPWCQTAVGDPQSAPLAAPEGFVYIKGGTFMMGSPQGEPDRLKDEKRHEVTVSGFYMGKFPVTQEEYEAVIGNNPSKFRGAALPVEQVSWYDAAAYCNKRSKREGLTSAYTINGENVTWNKSANGYRLPTEAEWEYACRAGTTTAFNTGETITTEQANYNRTKPYFSRRKTTPVGSFAANAWGLHDMHGNVWEWCWDWHGDYAVSKQTDPAGDSTGPFRVLRGGSWRDGERLRSAYRNNSYPGYRNNNVGFRLVRSRF